MAKTKLRKFHWNFPPGGGTPHPCNACRDQVPSSHFPYPPVKKFWRQKMTFPSILGTVGITSLKKGVILGYATPFLATWENSSVQIPTPPKKRQKYVASAPHQVLVSSAYGDKAIWSRLVVVESDDLEGNPETSRADSIETDGESKHKTSIQDIWAISDNSETPSKRRCSYFLQKDSWRVNHHANWCEVISWVWEVLDRMWWIWKLEITLLQ